MEYAKLPALDGEDTNLLLGIVIYKRLFIEKTKTVRQSGKSEHYSIISRAETPTK